MQSSSSSTSKNRTGFTLVELLLAMAIIGVLASILIVAINPTKQLGDARNTQRKFDVNSILNAFGQYSIDNGGLFQPQRVDGVTLESACAVTSTPKRLCKSTTLHGTAEGECGDPNIQCAWSRHLSGTYLADIPSDPNDAEFTTEELATVDYEVSSEAPGRFRVVSLNAENDVTIGAVR